MTSAYVYLLIGEPIIYMSATYLASFNKKRGYFCVICDSGSILSGSTNESHSQTSIIRLGIVVHEAIFQPLTYKGRRQFKHVFTTQTAVPGNITASGQDIIHPESNIEKEIKPDASRRGKRHTHRMTAALVNWQDKNDKGKEERRIL